MTKPTDSAVLIINAKSRSGKRQLKEAEHELRARGVVLSAVKGVASAHHFSREVGRAVRSGASLVIVGGGDGSLLCAVEHFVGRNTKLGVLPLGTANSFARALKLPLDLPGAAEVIAKGESRRVDLGMINQRYYAGCASIGIAPQIAETVPSGLKAWAGRPGYLLWAIGQFAKFRSFKLTVGDGPGAETLAVVEVRIANGPYHGGVELVDEARLDSGKIVVQVVLGQSRRDLFFNWIGHLTGVRAKHLNTREFVGDSLRLSTDRPMPISIDGEVIAQTPVVASVKPSAIMVMAPKSS